MYAIRSYYETDLKNLELISKQCRIEELKNGETEANTEEIERLTT